MIFSLSSLIFLYYTLELECCQLSCIPFTNRLRFDQEFVIIEGRNSRIEIPFENGENTDGKRVQIIENHHSYSYDDDLLYHVY